MPSTPVAFAVLAGPLITQVAPTWGPAAMTPVTVTGTGFGTGGTLTVGPTTVTPLTWSDTSVTCTVPALAAGGYPVTITQGAVSNAVPFVVGDEGAEYVHTDAIGSIRLVTGHDGYVLARYDYLPFGEPWPTTAPRARDGFAGTERDAETETSTWLALNYVGARHLHTASGRFTSVDPGHVGGYLGVPQSWNGYAYAGNNPLRYVDPAGTDYRVYLEEGSQFHDVEGDVEQLGRWAASHGFKLDGDSYTGVLRRLVSSDNALHGRYLSVAVDAPIPMRPAPVAETPSTGRCFADNYKFALKATNSYLFSTPGKIARTVIGAAASGVVARSTGLTTVGMAWRDLIRLQGVANLGFGGTLASIAAGSVVKTGLVLGALEAGIIVGSGVDASWQAFVAGNCQ